MKISKESKIAVLCGGISSEREISLKSGGNCFNALQRCGYKNSILVDVKNIDDIVDLRTQKIEIVFLTTHGRFGEDGSIQGILEWLRIPYTGSSLLASSISMDKWITKQIAKSISITTPKGYLLTNLNEIDLKRSWEELSGKNSAVFLKPKNDGSSVNTYKIKSYNELKDKINLLKSDISNYLIEEYIPGRELTVSIIELNNQFKVLPILEVKPKNEFYDYEAKYTKGMTEFLLPAKLEPPCQDELEKASVKIFSSIGCTSFGRVDYILDKNNIAYMLEVNSLPGMTDTSDLPAQSAYSGIKYDALVEMILQTARLHN